MPIKLLESRVKLKRNPLRNKTDPYINSHSNIKKKIKKTLIWQDQKTEEPQKIIITTKTQVSPIKSEIIKEPNNKVAEINNLRSPQIKNKGIKINQLK